MLSHNQLRCLKVMGILLWKTRTFEPAIADTDSVQKPTALRQPHSATSDNKKLLPEAAMADQVTVDCALGNSVGGTIDNMVLAKHLQPQIVKKVAGDTSQDIYQLPIQQDLVASEAVFACDLLIVIDDKSGLCLVGDLTKPRLAAEQQLLWRLLGRLGVSGKCVYQNVFHWPVSADFADKKSAEQALFGLLSNWKERRFVIALGASSFSLLLPNADFSPGDQTRWQDVTLLTSYSAQQLLLNKQLRYDTWQHLAAARHGEVHTNG